MTKTVKIKNGRYEVGLLWRYDEFEFPDSYKMANHRLESLLKKLSKDPELFKSLNQQIVDYIDNGYIREISSSEECIANTKVWYLPVFPVVNSNKPNKIRLVWDAAARVQNISLNSMLLKGPDLLVLLIKVLFQFREKEIGVCADIKQMFHQVEVREEDQQAQRFLWSFDGKTVKTFVMKVMTFGASCSPALAQKVKNENAMRFEKTHPEAVKAIINNHFVDDYLESFTNEEDAINGAESVKFIHSKGGFVIRNWMSNSAKVLNVMNGNSTSSKNMNMSPETMTPEKVLGLWWNTEIDCFQFKVTNNSKNKAILTNIKVPTKRELLRLTMSIFDPLGLLSHILIFLKILLQEVWRGKFEWDDPISVELYEKWLEFLSVLTDIENLQIPRCYGVYSNTDDSIELHIFVDASEKACAAVAYFRIQKSDGIHVALVMAKTRVAPLQLLSIPRLELESCVLGSRLAKTVKEGHGINVSKCQFWSDSKTALGWIKSDQRKYKQFVTFRVAEILNSCETKQWRYIPSKQNIADKATRWSKKPIIDKDDEWFIGPKILYANPDDWPEDISSVQPPEEEMRPVFHHNVVGKRPELIPEDHSSWIILRRKYAYLSRFFYNLKASKAQCLRRNGIITKEDYIDAENILFRLAQSKAYASEIELLKKLKLDDNLKNASKNVIKKSSPIYYASPFLDDKGVLRCAGRISNANISWDVKNPILLPKDDHITTLIIMYYHKLYVHRNSETIVNEIRQKYMFPHLRILVKKVAKACQECKIRDARPLPPMMGQLPSARLMSFTRPFTFMGIDYFGPINVTIGRSSVKRWGMLVTCLTTRGIHIETCSSLSTDVCIMVLRTVMARRGIPNEIYSDQGTNFRGASKELNDAVNKIDNEKLANEFNTPNTKWIFIPPASPHMGGAWERLVRSVKTTLQSMKISKNPSDELLKCMMVEVENIINSRPLTYVPLESENDEALTPNHFLLGSSNGMKPLGLFTDERITLKKNYMIAQQFSNQFWRRWLKEYLPDLTRRTKWYDKVKPIQVGDLVFIVDNDLPTNCWPKGRIIKVHTGLDGQVRKTVVQTANGVYERPAVKLAILDIGMLPDVAIPGGGVENSAVSAGP